MRPTNWPSSHTTSSNKKKIDKSGKIFRACKYDSDNGLTLAPIACFYIPRQKETQWNQLYYNIIIITLLKQFLFKEYSLSLS